MDMKAFYQGLDSLLAHGQMGNAYGGCGEDPTDPAANTLDNFYDYFAETYEQSMPPWMEAFVQVYHWQFETFHEGSSGYYENFYGTAGNETILRVAAFLRENGYEQLAEAYGAPALICLCGEYPEEFAHLLPDGWMNVNEETDWNFYVDILQKHREELLQ
ncbi:MAG: hypothetical protein K2O18_05300 [Oscillospiraceae bacterium]|nr:hypothetical protein [Oscillospiraceae bacterium]